MPAPISVNLVPKDEFLKSPVGNFLVWSLSVGRYIVIFTELIVILSFLSRFKLDRELTDLNEKIQVQKQTILSFADTESKFVDVKLKIDAIKRNQENEFTLESLDFLEKNTPVDIKLSRININLEGWSVEGSALSALGIKTMAGKAMVSNPDSTISISQIKLNGQAGTIDFNMSVRYKTNVTPAKKPVSGE